MLALKLDRIPSMASFLMVLNNIRYIKITELSGVVPTNAERCLNTTLPVAEKEDETASTHCAINRAHDGIFAPNGNNLWFLGCRLFGSSVLIIGSTTRSIKQSWPWLGRG
jgi:hypothetical protein